MPAGDGSNRPKKGGARARTNSAKSRLTREEWVKLTALQCKHVLENGQVCNDRYIVQFTAHGRTQRMCGHGHLQ